MCQRKTRSNLKASQDKEAKRFSVRYLVNWALQEPIMSSGIQSINLLQAHLIQDLLSVAALGRQRQQQQGGDLDFFIWLFLLNILRATDFLFEFGFDLKLIFSSSSPLFTCESIIVSPPYLRRTKVLIWFEIIDIYQAIVRSTKWHIAMER